MLQHDASSGRTFRPRRPHVVLRDHLEQQGTGNPGNEGDGEDAERQRRQHERPPAAGSPGWKPAVLHGEYVDQQQAEPEPRNRNAAERDHRGQMVHGRVLLQRRRDSQQDANGDRESNAAGGKLESLCESISDLARHGNPCEDRRAQVALDHLAQVDAITNDERAVQTVPLTNGVNGGSIRRFPCQDHRGVSGDQRKDEEDQTDGEEQQGDSHDEAAGDKH